MTLTILALAAGTMLVMALVMSFVLGWANRAFHVEVDPRVDQTLEALPGANCGGCGYVGCGEYAEAVVAGEEINKCSVGGESCVQALAAIMGVEVGASLPYRPIVHCGATWDDRLKLNPYSGEERCQAVNLIANVQGCTYGCLGYGDCEQACEYDAIHVTNGLAIVDYEACVGCGACAKVCPRNIISMAPFKSERMFAVACSNKDTGKDVKSVCMVGCTGCRACARFCELFSMEQGIARIDYDGYTSACTMDMEKACEKCPSKRIVNVGMPTDNHLEALTDEEAPNVVEPNFKTTVDDTEWFG